MRKKILYLLFCLLLISLLLVACTKQQPMIIKEDISKIDQETDEQIDEEPDDAQEDQQFLEFTLSDQQVTINIDQIPVLANYLEQHNDRNQAIEEMQLIPIMQEQHDSLYLLSFAHQGDSCSYLLLNTELGESQLLADQAKIINIEPSPDFSKVLFVFERNLTNKPWNINKLIIYNIEDWTEITLTEDNMELITLHAFRWPILQTNWLNDSELELQLPDIDKPTNLALEEWHESDDQPTKDIVADVK
ncbi:hypothetical protein KQI76_08945 [Amphibacillus sp. MSJ-3]|uniref:hypothetical protein n=1 Tax=Amphibacillus sp. MSJ-3 TaxID=2841505 RepID=UPI001C0EE7FF|nr:hypothetical protein [Amphibacillus sp. MSJ-3]MBU5595279.1 hypothetical protein [Amphibacillus sp. MSJ-3]